jgi:ectoine hydroxylase
MVAIPGALSAEQVGRLGRALDRVYHEECELPGGRMHLLGGIGRDEAFLELVDHPAVLPLVCAELGSNIHVYHCHLDVTPPRREPPAWRWHQDGGRQNADLETFPRPRMSLKVAFWLSDLSHTGKGNMLVVPGSHEWNTLPRPAGPELELVGPPGAEAVLAQAGDALVFDRRLWHSCSDNVSAETRKAIFVAYTYRWVRPRDDLGMDPSSPLFRRLSPVQRQLLGDGTSPRCYWGLGDAPLPLETRQA